MKRPNIRGGEEIPKTIKRYNKEFEQGRLKDWIEFPDGTKVKFDRPNKIISGTEDNNTRDNIEINDNPLFNVSCFDNVNDTANYNIYYEQADWCYALVSPYLEYSFAKNYMWIIGNIYIGENESTNPVYCNNRPDIPNLWELYPDFLPSLEEWCIDYQNDIWEAHENGEYGDVMWQYSIHDLIGWCMKPEWRICGPDGPCGSCFNVVIIPGTGGESGPLEGWIRPSYQCYDDDDNWEEFSAICPEVEAENQKHCHTIPGLCWNDNSDCMLPASNVADQYCPTHIGFPSVYPTYSNEDFNVATGYADAVALLHQGTIVSWEFVNNSIIQGDPSKKVIQLPIQTSDNVEPYLTGYPSNGGGDYIDDIILYKADTQTYHRLTDTSADEFFNGQWVHEMHWVEGIPPIGEFGRWFMGKYQDLVFNPIPLNETTYEIGNISGPQYGDTEINILDVQWLIWYIVGQAEITPQQMALADLNGDGVIDVNDVLQLVDMVLSDNRTSQQDRNELTRVLKEAETMGNQRVQIIIQEFNRRR